MSSRDGNALLFSTYFADACEIKTPAIEIPRPESGSCSSEPHNAIIITFKAYVFRWSRGVDLWEVFRRNEVGRTP